MIVVRLKDNDFMTDFTGIAPTLAAALTKKGYETLTPVQIEVQKPDYDGADMLVSAQTGSGKTVAFGIAIAPQLLQENGNFGRAEAPLALVVAPTRELALQVKRELDWLYGETGARIASCVGGMDIRAERRVLSSGTHIVVGTPGRLCDHIRRNALDISQIKAVVLDEADEMLDLGFREELEFILETTPEERRTLMFSATVPAQIGKLAKKYQRDAVRVSTAEEKKQHIDIEYRALAVAPRERDNAIINVLRYYEAQNALVFCNTRATVNHMVARFNNRGFSVVALSGELSQNERTHALQAMRDGRAKVCIATDVAARGIDLPNLDLVVHADLPSNPETLLHRSGRTGRAGRKGVSALIVDPKSRRKAERLLSMAKINASWGSAPSADEVIARDEERMLADPILIEPLQDEERDFVGKILAGFTPEQIATAFVRMSRNGKSAPEDIEAVHMAAPSQDRQREGRPDRPERADGKRLREEFGPSVWFSLSVGRKQSAEPRWLIPLICRAGDITKAEIGAIKMQPDETHIEIAADHAERFLAALGPNPTLEKTIKVSKLDGTPAVGAKSGKPKSTYKDGPKGDKPPFAKKGKKPFGPKDGKPRFSERKEGGKDGGKPAFAGKPKKPKRAPKPE